MYAYADGAGLTEEELKAEEKGIFNKTMAFVQPLYQNQGQLDGSMRVDADINAGADDGIAMEDDDPFGFEDLEPGKFLLIDDGSGLDMDAADGPPEGPMQEAVPGPVAGAGPEMVQDMAGSDEADTGGTNPQDQQEASPDAELSSAGRGPEDEALDNKIESLVNEVMTDTYNPDDYEDVDIPEEELDILANITDGDGPGAAELTMLRETGDAVAATIEAACRQISGVHQQVKDAVEKVAEASGSIFIREKEVSAREAGVKAAREGLQKDKQELAEMRGKLEEEREALAEYAETLKGISSQCEAAQAENKTKAAQIAALTEERDAAKQQLQELIEGGSGGTSAGQVYLKELRKKIISQDNYIAKADSRIAEFIALVKELQERASGAQAAADAKANAKIAAAEASKKEEFARAASKLEAEKSSLKEQVAKLEKEKKALQESRAKTSEPDTEWQERYDDMEEELIETTSKLQAVEIERDALHERCTELEEQAKQMHEGTGAEGDAAPDGGLAESPEAAAGLLCGSMKEIGVDLSPVPGEAKMMYGAEFQGCKIHVDIENRMLYITKELRKATAKRVLKDMERLNGLNIQSVYTMSGNELACRAAVFDLGKAPNVLLDILKEMCSYS